MTDNVASNHITGKTIVVTGAGSGFGRLICRCGAAQGARVACIDIAGEAAEETASMIVEAGGQAIAIQADVTDAAASCEAAGLLAASPAS